MLTYKLRNPPQQYDGNWLRQELQNIVKAANASNDGAFLRTNTNTPTKTNDGDIRIADGTNWNPRFGVQGLYWFSSSIATNGDWMHVVSMGPGGAVTQTSNKSTAVTLNTDCGDITMRNSALAANTAVQFTLNNSRLQAGDNLLVHHNSGGTAFAYSVMRQVSAGSAVIQVTNTTAGSLSEAIVLRFTRIPGATS